MSKTKGGEKPVQQKQDEKPEGAQQQGDKPDASAGDKGPEGLEPPLAAPATEGSRVVCDVVRKDVDGRECPMRDAVIDGVTFATVSISGRETHVSERIGAEKVQRFLGFPGYRVFDGGEDYDRLIEDAIDRARSAAPAAGVSSAERSFLEQLEEQRSINLAQAEELRRKDVIIRDQADEIHRLKGELARLREETGRK